MTYDWEQEAIDGIMAHIADLNEELAGRFQIWGVAIVNEEAAEGCYRPLNQPSGDILHADVAKDVAGDASGAYIEALTEMAKGYGKGNVG